YQKGGQMYMTWLDMTDRSGAVAGRGWGRRAVKGWRREVAGVGGSLVHAVSPVSAVTFGNGNRVIMPSEGPITLVLELKWQVKGSNYPVKHGNYRVIRN
ncbi:hypothetical protein THAOC_01846, partial [Thalassiosira oceanica]